MTNQASFEFDLDSAESALNSLISDEPTQPIIVRPTCPDCGRELCSELDSYYGLDDYWSRFCSRCRTARLRDRK